MGCEIEIKAHVDESCVDGVKKKLINFNSSEFLGEIDKDDIYWAKPGSEEPLFRTRIEDIEGYKEVLFTSKPMKDKDYGTEWNVENEFSCSIDQLEKIKTFCKGLGLVICRHKFKKGCHFAIILNGLTVHAELLNVKYLGWFLEMEICGEDLDLMDKQLCEMTLYQILDYVNVPRENVEPKGYNKLLKECGHQMG